MYYEDGKISKIINLMLWSNKLLSQVHICLKILHRFQKIDKLKLSTFPIFNRSKQTRESMEQ